MSENKTGKIDKTEKHPKQEKEDSKSKESKEDYLDQLKYLQADFENYKKRISKEREEFINTANENLIRELLTVLDDFEMANTHAKNKEDVEGLNLIHKNFLKILEKFGLKKINTKDKKFDHNFHDVLLKEPSDEEEGIILEELQAGYLLNGKVVRHSKIKISGGK
ncbi:MAG: nucleotide exchange factor GrpE [Candidatus Aenigmarchaeota archaeon]|nr:nucleotide exchange factor GrpE [Candidatus Aenigmarchaeota archaeon]